MDKKIISIKDKVSARFQGECQHVHVMVDDDLNTLECIDCGALLNPIAYIAKLAKQESRQWNAIQSLKDRYNAVKEKTRCKCQHCGQMTRIDKSLPTAEKKTGFKPEVVK